MELSEAAFDAANRRGAEKQASFPAALAVRYDRRISRIVTDIHIPALTKTGAAAIE